MLFNFFKKKDSPDSVIFNSSPEVIIFLDLKGRIVKVNKRIYEWLRIKESYFIGKNILDLAIISPNSKKLIKKNFVKRFRGESIDPYDIEVFKKNGDLEMGRVTGQLIKENGVFVGSLIMISNVTKLEIELKNKLQEVRENEIRYKGLFDNIKSAAIVCERSSDRDGFTIKEVNTYLRKLEKINKKDVIGKKLRTVFPGVDKSKLCQIVSKAWKEKSPTDFKFKVKKDGKEYLKEGNVYRIPTDELIVIYEDITHIEEVSEQIIDSEKKFRNIFESANDSIFLMDGRSFIDCNKKTLSIYGCAKRDDIVGKTPIDFSPLKQPDGQSSSRKALKYIRAAFNGKPQRFYWQHSKKNGELFDAEVSLNKVFISGKDYIQAVVRDITREKQALDKLERSEERLRLAQKVAEMGYWVWDIKSGGLEWSEETFNIFELDKSLRPTYSNFLKMIHMDDRGKVEKIVNDSLKSGKTYIIDHRITTGKGKERIVLEQGEVSYDSKGKPIQMIGVVRDITKSKLAEEKIEKNEERLQFLFDNNRDALFIAEAKTRRLVDVNAKAIQLTGYSKKKLLTMKADNLHPSELIKETMEGFKKQIQGKLDLVETEVLTRNKKRIPVSIVTSLSYEGDDKKTYVQGSFRDVSMRRNAEKNLEDSEQKLRTIIENIEAIIFIVNKEGKFVLSEGKGLSTLNLKPGQVVGLSAFNMYKDSPIIIKGINDALKGKITQSVTNVNGIYFSTFYSPYKDSQGEIIGVIGMAIDVTKSELAKAKLVDIDRTKSEFISMASHQLRTPLGNIRWELESLLENSLVLNEPVLKESLKKVYKHDLRLIELVGNLLNISRIENQKIMDKPERFNVMEEVKLILDEVNDQIEEKKLSLHCLCPESLFITYDKKLIREVLSNLINNSIKFNKKGGVIVFRLYKKNGKFMFQVANTGSIISKTDREHIFERFYRGSTIEDSVSGTGLGLHIAKEYVSRWNGNVSFESPAQFSDKSMNGDKYKGTIFSVELPISAK